MKNALTSIRDAGRMGLIWGAQWGLAGGFIEAFIDPRGAMVDMWPQTLAVPGFVLGVLFSAALQLAGNAKHERMRATA